VNEAGALELDPTLKDEVLEVDILLAEALDEVSSLPGGSISIS
jgi:hypothetical protein